MKKTLKSVSTFVIGTGMALSSMICTCSVKAMFSEKFYQEQYDKHKENITKLRLIMLAYRMNKSNNDLKTAIRSLPDQLQCYNQPGINSLYQESSVTDIHKFCLWSLRPDYYNDQQAATYLDNLNTKLLKDYLQYYTETIYYTLPAKITVSQDTSCDLYQLLAIPTVEPTRIIDCAEKWFSTNQSGHPH